MMAGLEYLIRNMEPLLCQEDRDIVKNTNGHNNPKWYFYIFDELKAKLHLGNPNGIKPFIVSYKDNGVTATIVIHDPKLIALVAHIGGRQEK